MYVFSVRCTTGVIRGILHMKIELIPPSNAYTPQGTGPSWVQVMACRLFGAWPLPGPMLAYCPLDSWEKLQWNLNLSPIIFIRENAFENVICQNDGHFVQGGGGDEWTSILLYNNSLWYTVLQPIECTTSTSMSAMTLSGEQLIHCVISTTISPQMAQCLLCSVTNRLPGGTCQSHWCSHQKMNWLCVKCMCMVTVSIG